MTATGSSSTVACTSSQSQSSSATYGPARVTSVYDSADAETNLPPSSPRYNDDARSLLRPSVSGLIVSAKNATRSWADIARSKSPPPAKPSSSPQLSAPQQELPTESTSSTGMKSSVLKESGHEKNTFLVNRAAALSNEKEPEGIKSAEELAFGTSAGSDGRHAVVADNRLRVTLKEEFRVKSSESANGIEGISFFYDPNEPTVACDINPATINLADIAMERCMYFIFSLCLFSKLISSLIYSKIILLLLLQVEVFSTFRTVVLQMPSHISYSRFQCR
ncbi:hypothetical protein AB6A40_011145 [Gnathostoma spinigerum]|uniref:Uncharacterized protein n=1 Tax=Gnathostoma spinigerum TaxID=75299 RepID=A0ABD6EYK4_9BILA